MWLGDGFVVVLLDSVVNLNFWGVIFDVGSFFIVFVVEVRGFGWGVWVSGGGSWLMFSSRRNWIICWLFFGKVNILLCWVLYVRERGEFWREDLMEESLVYVEVVKFCVV